MRRFHLARAAILARVAGLRESIVPLLRLWTRGGLLGVRPQLVECFLENRSLRCFREFGDGGFHKFYLPLVIRRITADWLRSWFNSLTDHSLHQLDFRAIGSSHPPKP